MPPETKIMECLHDECDPQVIRDEFEAGPVGERVKVVAENVPVEVCRRCKEVVYGSEAARVRYRAIIAALGYLGPEEIRAVRERLGLSQEAFARLTGIELDTVTRWERGRLIQSRAMDNYLRLLGTVPDVAAVLGRKTAAIAAVA
jgi:putative zinc finger/helix-turn-helix YgiT family protein